jgi:hypothetical protein
MDRIIVILDQLKEKYVLISGGNQAQIEIDRKISNPKKGYTLLLDRKMPFNREEKLNIGPDARLYFSIRCNKLGECEISYDEYEWLDKLFNAGSRTLKINVEGIANRIKSNLVSSNRDPHLVYSLLDIVFPKINELVESQLYELENHFPYIRMEAHANINISDKLELRLENTQDLIGQAWLKITTDPLQSAYEPEEELKQRMDHFDRARKTLPLPDCPSSDDIIKALKIIKAEEEYYQKQKRFGILGDRRKLPSGQ